MQPSENDPGRRTSRPSVIVNWIVPVMIAVQVLVTLVIYPFLPNILPAHWNAAGQVDSYEPKWLFVGFLPVLSLGLYLFLRFLSASAVPKPNAQSQSVRTQQVEMAQMIVKLLMFFLQVIFLVTQVILLIVALHNRG